MNLTAVLAFLAPFEALLEPELLQVEANGVAELNTIIAGVSSPDLKLLLQALSGALDAFSKAEIAKL